MTPAARVQSAIEILDAIVVAAKSQGAPADRIVAEWARSHRFAGSKDRRAIRELVYGAIRACGPVPDTGRAAMLRLAEQDGGLHALFDGSNYGPRPIADGEAVAAGGIAPSWLAERLAASDIAGDEAAALLDRAPLDLRVNTLKAARATLELPEAGKHLAAPQGLRFAPGTMVTQWPEWRDGLVEVQDHGSQWACEAVAAQPGESVIDLCAGAGGKTLALAAAMDNRGTLVASDTDRKRLSELAPRAERAGVAEALLETRLLDPMTELEQLADLAGRADAVLVDAPCSGTGTWRRNPEARWRLDEAQLARFAETQDRLLDIAAKLVRAGGRIVYVTCSLLDEEGADRVAAFLARHPGWQAEQPNFPLGRARGEGARLTPCHDGTDGFFVAKLLSPC